MTKKDHAKLAQGLLKVRPEKHNESDYATWMDCCNAIMIVLRQDNHILFDSPIFIKTLRQE